eukprot:7380297-Prymnesium_polylepis.7
MLQAIACAKICETGESYTHAASRSPHAFFVRRRPLCALRRWVVGVPRTSASRVMRCMSRSRVGGRILETAWWPRAPNLHVHCMLQPKRLQSVPLAARRCALRRRARSLLRPSFCLSHPPAPSCCLSLFVHRGLCPLSGLRPRACMPLPGPRRGVAPAACTTCPRGCTWGAT